jgi:predicted RNA binding protein YcfA (HicA-like mRNA interferase family)
MPKWKPCKRRDFIKKLKKFGFEPPAPGGRHFYMRYDTYTLTLPNNKEYSVPQIKTRIDGVKSFKMTNDSIHHF